MSAPKVGFHARLRRRAVDKYAQLYPAARDCREFEVVHVDGASAKFRRSVHLKAPDGALIPAWLGDVTPLPRCCLCNAEGHTSSRVTRKNCAEVRRLQAEAKAERKAANAS